MASIGDVVSIISLTDGAAKYLNAVLHQTKQEGELKDQLSILKDNLQRAKLELSTRSGRPKDDIKLCLEQVHRSLIHINNNLKPPSNILKRYSRKVSWPARREAIEQALETVRRQDHQLQQALAAEHRIEDLHDKELSELDKLWDNLRTRLRPEQHARLSQTPQRVQSTTKGTGKWFQESKEVTEWGTEAGFTWIYGSQGSGKTGQMVRLVDKLRESAETQPPFVACVYCDSSTTRELRDPFDIIMSLWCQIADIMPFKLLEKASLQHWTKEFQVVGGESEKKAKMGIMKWIVARAENVSFIVDGLDEIPQEMLIETIECLQGVAEAHQVRLMVTSRAYSDILCHAREDQDRKVEFESNEIDLRLFIQDRIERAQVKFLHSKGLLEDNIAKLARTDCTFQIAKIYMDELCRANNLTHCRSILNGLPTKIFELYELGFESLSKRRAEPLDDVPSVGIEIIFWVSYAIQAMTAEQIIQATAVRLGDEDYDKGRETPLTELEPVCGRYILVDQHTGLVHVAHKSIQDYVMTEEARKKWFPNIRSHIPAVLMTFLSLNCMRTGTGSTLHEIWPRNDYSLLPYAMIYWGMGLDESLESDGQLLEQAERFLRICPPQWNSIVNSQAIEALFYLANRKPSYPPSLLPVGGCTSGLHWIVAFNLYCLLQPLQECENATPSRDPIEVTPLGLAAMLNRHGMAEQLLENTDLNQVVSESQALVPPLYYAIEADNPEFIKLFLENGADLTLRSLGNDESPLEYAHYCENREILGLLASHISKKKVATAQGLQFLIKGEFESDLRHAIEGGLDVNHPCENGKRALDYANEFGSATIIELLEKHHAVSNMNWLGTKLGPYHKDPSDLRLMPLLRHTGPVLVSQRLRGADQEGLSGQTGDSFYSSPHTAAQKQIPGLDTASKEGIYNLTSVSKSEETMDIDYPFGMVYLKVNFDERLQYPIKTLVFSTLSGPHWYPYSPRNGGMPQTSRSWIEVRLRHGDRLSQRLILLRNVVDLRGNRLHVNIWNVEDMLESSPARVALMQQIRPGTSLELLVCAQRGPEDCSIDFARVQANGQTI